MQHLKPCLWFHDQGLDAAEFYVSLIPNSRITDVSHYGEGAPLPAGTPLMVEFELDGRPYQALNGGPAYTLTEAFSLSVRCQDQAEADHYWDVLTADGGVPGQCGWLVDRFGLSWQIVPDGLIELMMDPDPGRSSRAMQAMMTMSRIDLAAMRAAADQA